jgi:hypothetical protein
MIQLRAKCKQIFEEFKTLIQQNGSQRGFAATCSRLALAAPDKFKSNAFSRNLYAG